MTSWSSDYRLCLASQGRPWVGLRHTWETGNSMSWLVGNGLHQSDVIMECRRDRCLVLFSSQCMSHPSLTSSHHTAYNSTQYADDTRLYIAAKSQSDMSRTLEECTIAVRDWFTENGMLLNPDKSEVLLVARRSNAEKFAGGTGICVAGFQIAYSVKLKSLGVTLDNELSFDQHVNNIVKASNFNIRALRHIRPMLDQTVANTVACSIVSTRLDYCNLLLLGTSAKNIDKLQRVQNTLARVVSCTRRRDHITPVLRKLHWLPVAQRLRVQGCTHHAQGAEHSAAPVPQQPHISEYLAGTSAAIRRASGSCLSKPTGLLSAIGHRTLLPEHHQPSGTTCRGSQAKWKPSILSNPD